MSPFTSISPDKPARLIGTASLPALIDVRTDEDFAADRRLNPGAVRQKLFPVDTWTVAALATVGQLHGLHECRLAY